MHYGDNRPKYIRWAIYALIIAGAVLLQNSVGGLAEIFGVRIFLVLPVLISIAMFERELPSAILGAIAGVLWDVSCSTDGFNAIVLMIIPAGCSLLISHFMRNNLVTAMVLGAGGIGAYELVYIILKFTGQGFSFGYLFTFYLPAFLLTVLFMPIGYEIIKIIYNSHKTADE